MKGLAEQTGFRLGRIVILVGAVVLMPWLPLHERPGIGTLSNVVVVGLARRGHSLRLMRTGIEVSVLAAGIDQSRSGVWRRR